MHAVIHSVFCLLSDIEDAKWHKNREPEWTEPRNVCLHVSKHFEVNGFSLVLTFIPAYVLTYSFGAKTCILLLEGFSP